ncbi:MAG: hypothetical protein LBU60_01485, partial [Clostridiales bacterium]|nr:hypothetical protein [Clostridiales bacterium]
YYNLQKQSDEKRIVDYEVYKNGLYEGLSSQNFAAENPYLDVWQRSFYDGDGEEQASKLEMDKQHKLTYLSYTVRGLVQDTQYNFKVRALYADRTHSEFSQSIRVQTQKPYSKIEEITENLADIVAVRDATNQARANNSSSWDNVSVYRRANFGVSIDSTQTDLNFIAVTKSTAAIQKMIDQTPPGGKVIFVGTGDNANPIYYLSGALFLHSDMTLEIQTGAVLLGSPSIDHYPRNLLVYPYSGDIRSQGLINASTYDYGELKNIRVTGGGIVDGNGVGHTTNTGAQAGVLGDIQTDFKAQVPATLDPIKNSSLIAGKIDPTNGGGAGQWRLPKYFATSNGITYDTPAILSADAVEKGKSTGDNLPSPSNAYNTRPQLAVFRGVNGLLLEGLTWVNPSFHGIVNYQSEHITAIGTKVMSFDSNNGDGIEFGDSLDLHILNNFYDTGDDAINFAAGQGAVVRNTTDRVASGEAHIFNNYVRNGHGFVVGGSHTGGVIGDILAQENIYKPSETGGNGIIRLKSGPNTGGGNRRITWRDGAVFFANDSNMLIFDRSYSDSNASTSYAPESEVPVVYQDINFLNATIGGVSTANLVKNNTSGTAVDSYKMVIFAVHIEDIVILSTGNSENAGRIELIDISDSSFKNIEYHGGAQQDKGNISSYVTLHDSRNITVENIVGDSGEFENVYSTNVDWNTNDRLTASALGNKVTLSWPKVERAVWYEILVKEENELVRYFVYRDVVGNAQSDTVAWSGVLSGNLSYQVAVIAFSEENNGNTGVSDYLITTVKTGLKTQDMGQLTMPNDREINRGSGIITGVSWQKLFWDNPTYGMENVQYFLIDVAEYSDEEYSLQVDSVQYRVYYDSYLKASSALFQDRNAYSLSNLKPNTYYKASISVFDWAGQERGKYDDFEFKTFSGTLDSLPQWNMDSSLFYFTSNDNKRINIYWDTTGHTIPSIGGTSSRFAGYRINIDGVPLMAVSDDGEVINQVNAVSHTKGNNFMLNGSILTPGKHTISVQTGVQILTFYSNAPSGEYQDKSILGTNNLDQLRNKVTLGKWTMHGPKLEVYVNDDYTIGESKPTYVNKELLAAKIAVAETLVKSDYTMSTWESFLNVLKNAKIVYSDETSTQQQVDAQVDSLQSSINSLVRVSGQQFEEFAFLIVIFAIMIVVLILTLTYVLFNKKYK